MRKQSWIAKKWFESRHSRSYTHLYQNLVEILREENLWGSFVLGALTGVLVIYQGIKAKAINSGDWLVSIFVLLVAVSIFFYFLFVVYLSYVGSREPSKKVAEVVVRLMTTVSRPYTDQYGLGYREIERLKRVAEIEQGAADWRNSYVSIIILGTISVAVAGYPIFVNPSFGQTNAVDGSQSLMSFLIQEVDPVAQILLVLAVVATIISLYSYLRRYLANEYPNRTILLACEEALAFLEAYSLENVSEFRFYEKRAIAAHFGCRIVSREEASLLDRLWSWGEEDSSGMIWFLVPPAESSILIRLIQGSRFVSRQQKRWFREVELQTEQSKQKLVDEEE